MFFIHTLRLSALLLMVLLLPGAVFANTKTSGISIETAMTEMVKDHPEIKWVAIADIEKSLPKKPINVGFDLDDTVFFSSACFYKSTNEIIKRKKLQNASTKQLWSVINKDQKYWDEVSSCNAGYAIPKQAALDLIKMHQKRGDKIFFITAKNAPSKKSIAKKVDDGIKALFLSSAGLQPVQYSNIGLKTALIKQDKLAIYYGDSDGDIKDAQAANVRAIRFIRSAASTYLPIPLNGHFGEEVLIGSYR